MDQDSKSIGVLSAIVGNRAAKRLYNRFGSLMNIGRQTNSVLIAASDAGEKRIEALKGAFQLAESLATERLPRPYVINRTGDAANLLREHFRLMAKEELHVLLIDATKQLIEDVVVHPGSVTGVGISASEVFTEALLRKAAAIILVHNHPAPNLTPSKEDISFTNSMKRAGEHLRIPVVDHVIVSPGYISERGRDYVSLKELGLF